MERACSTFGINTKKLELRPGEIIPEQKNCWTAKITSVLTISQQAQKNFPEYPSGPGALEASIAKTADRISSGEGERQSSRLSDEEISFGITSSMLEKSVTLA